MVPSRRAGEDLRDGGGRIRLADAGAARPGHRRGHVGRAGVPGRPQHRRAAGAGGAGQRIESIPTFAAVGKGALQDSFGGSEAGPTDDLLVGRGMFYITEQGRLCLDCTSGHYQMLWGYNDPQLCRAVEQAVRAGIVWDNHCQLPQSPVKALARRLVELANAPDEPDPLDTVLLGTATGSVACAAALKIQLICHERRTGSAGPPVLVALDGNYHGTDMVAQRLRGMWRQYIDRPEVALVQPDREVPIGKRVL